MAVGAHPSKLTGSCQCGAVRYVISGEPLALYVCHCRECRKQSASAFGISLMVRREDLQLCQGAVQFWSRATDSGRTLTCAFCPGCGSRVWHQQADPALPISVKGGSLDLPLDLSAAVHIWTERKLRGVVIPAGARQFAGEPS